jgi:hypothetical protein
MTTTLFVLDVDDFRPLAEVAAKDPDLAVVKRGPYFEVLAEREFRIQRNATGCRNAVWYSAVAAIRGGRVTQWDKDVLVIAPKSDSGTPGEARDV